MRNNIVRFHRRYMAEILVEQETALLKVLEAAEADLDVQEVDFQFLKETGLLREGHFQSLAYCQQSYLSALADYLFFWLDQE